MRWLLALWLAIAPACAQEAVIGSGVYGGTKAIAYTGPGDIVSGAKVWWGMRAYNAAIASAATQKAINVRNTGTNETCDVKVATNGGLATTVSNCSGASSGTALSTFCSACAITKWYDQSGANNCTGAACDVSQATAADQATLTLSCVNSLPCAVGVSNVSYTAAANFTSVAQTDSAMSVINITSATGNPSWYDTNTNSGQQQSFASNTANRYMYAGNLPAQTATSTGAFHVSIGIYNGASSNDFLDGTSVTKSVGTQSASGPLALFSKSDGTASFSNGDITEVGIWPSDVTSSLTSFCHNPSNYYGLGVC